MKEEPALSKTDECCIEGWRVDNESLKASCDISKFVYEFSPDDMTCLLDTTTILPTTNTRITTSVSNDDCCNNSSGPNDPLAAACEFVVNNFTVITDAKTWIEAEKDCVDNYDGHLVSMHSEVENTKVAEEYASSGQQAGQFWIGFREWSLFGWGWSDGDRTEYANW